MTATIRPRQVIAVLLVVAAARFVLGVRTEGDNDSHTDEPDEPDEQGEASEQREAAEEGEEVEETVLGLDLESPLLVGAAVVVSILLAGLTLARRDRRLLLTVAAFAGAFAVLDAAEVVHQLDEDGTGLTLLATVVDVLHVGAAPLALQQASSPTSPAHQPAST